MAKPNPFKWVLDATFASKPNATVVEPTVARKEAGWLRGQKIPAQALNWALHSIQEQIDWLLGEAFNETMKVPASLGESQASTPWQFGPALVGGQQTAWFAPGSGTSVLLAFPLAVPVGRRITAVRAHVVGHTGSVLDLLVMKSVAAGSSQVGTTQSSGLTSTAQTLAVTGLTELVAAGDSYYHAIIRANTSNNVSQRVYGVEVDHDRP